MTSSPPVHLWRETFVSSETTRVVCIESLCFSNHCRTWIQYPLHLLNRFARGGCSTTSSRLLQLFLRHSRGQTQLPCYRDSTWKRSIFLTRKEHASPSRILQLLLSVTHSDTLVEYQRSKSYKQATHPHQKKRKWPRVYLLAAIESRGLSALSF